MDPMGKQINMVCFRHGRDFLSFVGRYIMSQVQEIESPPVFMIPNEKL